MSLKKFYEDRKSFSGRTISEYFLSPGIRCKFDLIKDYIGSKRKFKNGIDLGCSGNSILYFLNSIIRKSFFDIAYVPLRQYKTNKFWHPICGDLIHLPYRDESFDFVSALDVIEHIKEDQIAVSEISRILRKNGIAVITVPHRKKYFTKQDKLIGHYRRYEIPQIISLFKKYNLRNLRIFGVYGRLMKIADIQSATPEKLEENLERLREKYESDATFRKFWTKTINLSSKIMKLDAKYLSLKKVMNIAFIFIKT